MTSHNLDGYLRDLGFQLRQRAIEARLEYEAADRSDKDAKLGSLMAFYEVLSLMQEQADAFGIGPETLGLEGFDADSELL